MMTKLLVQFDVRARRFRGPGGRFVSVSVLDHATIESALRDAGVLADQVRFDHTSARPWVYAFVSGGRERRARKDERGAFTRAIARKCMRRAA